MSDERRLPADRAIWLRGEVCSTGLWSSDGLPIEPENLPIAAELRARLVAWARWYDELDDLAPHQGSPWEGQPGMPTAAFTARTRELAIALTKALPVDWVIVAEDVDAWRFPADERDARRLVLAGGAGDRR